MNHQRFVSVLQGVSCVARKVYEATPIVELWSRAKIVGEIKRMTGSTPDVRVVSACLLELTEVGLVVESPRGSFRREKVSKSLDKPVVSNNKASIEMTNKSVSVAPMSLAARVGDMVSRLTNIAAELESVAIEVDAQIAAAGAEGEKLRQLKSLLKDLG